MEQRVERAVSAIRAVWNRSPRIGIVLGTGMGALSHEVEPEAVLNFVDIPHFPRPTAPGHGGRLVCGAFAAIPDGPQVMVMDGRPHLYEGYSFEKVTFPIRVMQSLGVEILILSNAAGGLNIQYATGDIVVVESHINLLGSVGRVKSGNEVCSVDTDGFVGGCSRTSIYDPALIDRAMSVSRRESFPAHRGTYVVMSGPSYETRAEYRLLRRLGGDVVGMSTVPEALVAATCGMRVLALSIVTNVAKPDAPKNQKVSAVEVLHDAEHSANRVAAIIFDVVRSAE